MDSIRGEITGRGNQNLKPLGLSIKETASITGESQWQVKQKLRSGIYRAKKSGRRTIVIYATVEAAWDKLPQATFKKPSIRTDRKQAHIPA